MPDPSLIARSRISSPAAHIARGGMGILLVLAIIFVAVVLAVYGGVLGYRTTLESQLASATDQLQKLEEKFEPDNVRKIAEADRALSVARALLSAHVYSTNMFRFLEAKTLKNARYRDFAYTTNPRELALSTEVEGYVGLKRQIEILEESQFIRSAVFSSLSRGESGTVGFRLVVAFEDNLLRFGAVEGLSEELPTSAPGGSTIAPLLPPPLLPAVSNQTP